VGLEEPQSLQALGLLTLYSGGKLKSLSKCKRAAADAPYP
jgi:hypothetical protein